MPATEAFALLVSAGVFAYQPRDPAQIAALVAWFGGLASYALAYDDLDDACGLVREALDAGTDAPLRQPYPRAKP